MNDLMPIILFVFYVLSIMIWVQAINDVNKQVFKSRRLRVITMFLVHYFLPIGALLYFRFRNRLIVNERKYMVG